MRLVTFDIVKERWRSYEIDDEEVYFPVSGEETTDKRVLYDTAVTRRRVERVWRYEYRLGWELVRGVACIAPSAGAGRARIHLFLKREANRDREAA